jgi:hypothetical protein
MTETSPNTPIALFVAKLKTLWRIALVRSVLLGLAVLVLCVGSGTAYASVTSPKSIRQPAFEHLHFRMQIVVDGKSVNFAEKKFQEGYAGDNCNVALTTNPIHFHDNKDQFVHIHWKDMTGGMVLKYYGWNHIGGPDGLLGYRFDKFPNMVAVPTHGNELPKVNAGDKFYVYAGDENGYKSKSFDSFVSQDIETFFNKKSLVESEPVSLLERLFPKAAAHGGVEHGSDAEATEHSQEDLKRLNNLVGNVVIFSQKDKPSDEAIKARFADLEPLSDSTCAG